MSSREAWHTGTFWLMISAFFLQSVGFHGYIIHLVPLLTDRGVSAQSAALVVSLGAVGADARTRGSRVFARPLLCAVRGGRASFVDPPWGFFCCGAERSEAWLLSPRFLGA